MTATRAACPRCNGPLIRQYAEVLCAACGYIVQGDNGPCVQSPLEPRLTLPWTDGCSSERHTHNTRTN